MNKNIIQGKWKEIKGRLQQQWGKLSDDEISKLRGSYDELSGMLQKKYGYDQERTHKEIEQFLKSNKLDESSDESKKF